MKRTMTIVLNLSQNESVTTDLAERRGTFIAHCYMHNVPMTPKIMLSKVPSCTYNNKLLLILLNEKQGRPETCNFLWSFKTLSSQENLLENPRQSAKWETCVPYLTFLKLILVCVSQNETKYIASHIEADYCSSIIRVK